VAVSGSTTDETAVTVSINDAVTLSGRGRSRPISACRRTSATRSRSGPRTPPATVSTRCGT
jgi:hypothetical protein